MEVETRPIEKPRKAAVNQRLLLLVISAAISVLILNLPLSIRTGSYSLKPGDVALQDILTSRSFSYESNILTTRARQQARDTVSPVYLPADSAVKKRQLEKFKEICTYITEVRDDTYATPEQKMNDLVGIADLSLSLANRQRLIEWSDARWQAIQQEARQVLDDSYRGIIRPETVDSVRRNIDSLVDVTFNQEQVNLIHELVAPLILPNSMISEELTRKAQEDAEAAVAPVQRAYAAGQIIVQHGQVVQAEDIEALQQAGLTGSTDSLNSVLASVAMVTILAAFLALYVTRRRALPLDDMRSLALISVLFNLILLLARFLIPFRTVMPFVFPIAAFGMALATAFNLEIGLVFGIVLSILSAYNLPGSLEITIYYLLGSLTGVLVLGRGRKISSFFQASLGVSLANFAVILAYRLGDPSTDIIGITTLAGASLLNGLLSASMALIIQLVFSQFLGITTALQLLEISRPDHPLLQYILRNAPGTYQHSLQVANLAEQAAEQINADSLLVRVGALYHDAGKALNPLFFIENQIKGSENPHDDLDPAISATIILKHVRDGEKIAGEYHIPPRIQDFIREHHGTMLTRYQYNRAVEAAEGNKDTIDESLYRYPGPKPRSRETAILMLADGCEARARAELPKTEAEVRILVQKMVDYALKEKQLEDTKLTMQDLKSISESFVTTLMGVYHQRIIYPEINPPSEPETGKSYDRDTDQALLPQ